MSRRQLPAHSPLSFAALAGAVRPAFGGPDPRPTLAARLRRVYGAERVILTDSGTDALRLAIEVARSITPHSAPVALPAYSCYDVATAAIGADASILLYDLDPRTLAPEWDSLRGCLERGARTVVLAPLFGIPIDLDPLASELDAHGVIVIEDAAQGHGAELRGRCVGGWGRISTLSFGRGKGWTGAGGGAALFRTPGPWSEKLTVLGARSATAEAAGLGAALSQWLLARPSIYALCALVPGLRLGQTIYHQARAARPMRRSAAMLLERTWSAAMLEVGRRRINAAWFSEALQRSAMVSTVDPPATGRAGWLRFPVLRRGGWDGVKDPEAATALGIVRGYPRPLAELPEVVARLASPGIEGRWPGATRLAAELLTLPTHSLVSAADRSEIVRQLER